MGKWRQPSGRPLALNGVWDGSVIRPLKSLGAEANTTLLRVAADQPFASDAPANVSVGSGAIFESTSDPMTAAYRSVNPELNRARWSVSIVRTSIEDPIVTVNDPNNGSVRATCRVPVDAKVTGGTDGHMAVVQPDGRTQFEFYAMTKVDDTHWTSPYVVQNDLFASGITAGARASGTSIVMGIIRKAEVDTCNIPHTLTLGLPGSVLKQGWVWPARLEDGDSATSYTGVIPMGTMFAIPSSVDLSGLVLSAEGRALAVALQDFGAHVAIRADTAALAAEPTCDPDATERMRQDWITKLAPLVRRLINNTAANVAGGGTRRRPPPLPVR